MSSETIEVKKREATGSIASRKLRMAGSTPAILYGHGEENINLTVSTDAIQRVIQHGTKLLALTGDVNETALLRDVQWDAFGIEVLHVDLNRVSKAETVEVTLPVELHGQAPGLSEGGKISFPLHEIVINCPAGNIPESLEVNVSNLHVGDAIHANEIQLPTGASLVTNEAEVVVQIPKPTGGAAEAEEGEEAAAEPEVIGKGKDDSEESED